MMAGEENILEVSDVINRRLSRVSFQLKKGEILGFGGLVGAGRTEMARALFGADKIRSGKFILKGKEYKPENPAKALKNGIMP